MTEIVCPLCGKSNPPDANECQYCQAPLKTGGFIAPATPESESSPAKLFPEQGAQPEKPATKLIAPSNLEDSIPDWLKETEAGFLESTEPTEESPASPPAGEQIEPPLSPPPAAHKEQESGIDDDWLASLLAESGAMDLTPSGSAAEIPGMEILPDAGTMGTGADIGEGALPAVDKPDWLADMEAASKIKLEGEIIAPEQEAQPLEPIEKAKEKAQEPEEKPEWLNKPLPEIPAKPLPETPAESSREAEAPLAAAEIPGWLEPLRPAASIAPTGPVEDVSGADLVTAGPLVGLRGVISAHPSAIRAQKPPTYSIKLKVTEEQQARLQMMEELLAEEEKPKPLPSRSIIGSSHIIRLIVAVLLILPIIYMIASNRQATSAPQPGTVPGVVDFTQQIQLLPANATVLIAFDYEAGYSGEVTTAITNVLAQLMKKSVYLTLLSTSSAGPALAESMIKSASSKLPDNTGSYVNYANLGFVPGGTMGLLGLAASPKSSLPYALDGSNVWAGTPLKAISSIKDFSAVLVITSDPDTARIWIEQIGPKLQEANKPLLFIASSQAGPLILPYYQSTPAQVQGLLTGLVGGIAYARTVGNYQQTGSWDALSAGITISILIILIGSISGVVIKMLAAEKKTES